MEGEGYSSENGSRMYRQARDFLLLLLCLEQKAFAFQCALWLPIPGTRPDTLSSQASGSAPGALHAACSFFFFFQSLPGFTYQGSLQCSN